MAEIARVFKKYQKRKGLSLRAFAQAAGIPYWHLRDYLKRETGRQTGTKEQAKLKALIKRLALKHPTYGYRRIHREVIKNGVGIGIHNVRKSLAEPDLTVKVRRKPSAKLPEPTPAAKLPEGRRIQMDATQVI